MCGAVPRVLLACAHHPKLDDLTSISCVLSMRLYRHANNRKFALKGIDQQPLTLSRDSEVSHGCGASERTKRGELFCFFFLCFSCFFVHPQESWAITGIVLWVTTRLEVETSPNNSHQHGLRTVCHCRRLTLKPFPLSVALCDCGSQQVQVWVFVDYSNFFFLSVRVFPDEKTDGKNQGECERAYGGCQETEWISPRLRIYTPGVNWRRRIQNDDSDL